VKFPLNAVVQIESEDLGHEGAIFIAPREKALTLFPSIKELTEFFDFVERGGRGPHPPMLIAAFGALEARPASEQKTFRRLAYDLAAPDAYPFATFVTSMKKESPSARDFEWLELSALALARIACEMIDTRSWSELRPRSYEIETHRDVGAVRVMPINEHAGAPDATVEAIKVHEESILKKTGASTMEECVRHVREMAANMGRN